MSGEVAQGVKSLWELLAPSKVYYPSGIKDWDKGFYRYAYPSTESPILTIIDPIYDSEGNAILPGHYTLILAYDRKTLVLTQSGNLIATFPVFKYEEDPDMGKQVMDKKALKAQLKEEKKMAKKNKQRAKKCLDPLEKPKFMKASIDYDVKGGYYLIKYEKEGIRAWGALKSEW